MSYTRHYFSPRKFIDDFRNESLLNRILYECLKKNFSLPDETILAAFNNAYQTCINVLAEPVQQTLLSDNLSDFAANAPRSSLLQLCLAFFLLSFHEEAESLGHYLANLQAVLDTHLPEIFRPLQAATSILSSGSTVIADTPCEPLPERKSDSVKIANLIKTAQELPKHDADVLLKALQVVIAEEECDWKELVKLAIEQNSSRIEHAPPRSPYHIIDRKMTAFVKLFRLIYKLHIFEKNDGSIVSNSYDFIVDLGNYFNTKINNPRNLMSAAKRTDCFMDEFNRLRSLAEAYYNDEDQEDDDEN